MRPDTPTRRDALVAAAIVALAFALRWSGFGHAFILFDDYAYVLQNPSVRDGLGLEAFVDALTRIVAGHWHPLTIWSLAANVELSGLRAGPMVMTNAALHALNAGLVMLLLRRFGFALGASAFGGLLFALHPAHVESYAWIAERKDVLAATLFLATLHAWRSWTERRARREWAAALVLFALALMAKPMAVTLPAVLLLLEIWPGRRHPLPIRKRVAETIPFFVLSAAAGVLAIYTQNAGGAMRSVAIATPLDRIENALFAWSWSLRTWLVPRELAVFHPWREHAPGAIARDVAILAALTVLAILAWRRRGRCGAGVSPASSPPRPCAAILVGWLWFVGMLVPVSGVVQVGLQSVADRYLYLPGIGLLIAALGAWSWWSARSPHTGAGGTPAPHRAAAILALAWLVILAVQSHRQFALWRASEPLFRQAVAVHPEAAFPHYLLGLALVEQSRWGEAEASLRRAIELQTGGAIRRGRVYETWLAQAHGKLSEALRRLGRAEEAIAYAERATLLAPGEAGAWLELGEARAAARRPDTAAAWERAAAIDPASFDARLRLGILYAIEGDAARSIGALESAVRLRPESVEARVQLALSLAAAERFAEAAAQLEAATRIDRPAANRYLEQTAGFAPSRDTIERYVEFLRRK